MKKTDLFKYYLFINKNNLILTILIFIFPITIYINTGIDLHKLYIAVLIYFILRLINIFIKIKNTFIEEHEIYSLPIGEDGCILMTQDANNQIHKFRINDEKYFKLYNGFYENQTKITVYYYKGIIKSYYFLL